MRLRNMCIEFGDRSCFDKTNVIAEILVLVGTIIFNSSGNEFFYTVLYIFERV